MAKDVIYTNGVISAKETLLLGAKLLKLCAMSAEEVFRTLMESGFARNTNARSVFEYEKLLYEDERALDAFVREYAPTNAESAYFLAPRDFHNAKALLKARYSGLQPDKMLAPDGLLTSAEIARCVEENDFSPLFPELKEACESVSALFADGEKNVSGAEVGVIFARAEYKYLLSACRRNSLLKKFVIQKSDMTDILSAFRAQTPEYALNNALLCGKLTKKHIEALFEEDGAKALKEFEKTPYYDFVKACLSARENGEKLTRAELMRDNLETDYLSARKYELKAKEPFIYYVLRRKAENSNLRIIFVCLTAGLKEDEIKARLRGL